MRIKINFKNLFISVIATSLILSQLPACFMSPAPAGIHGIYSAPEEISYQTNFKLDTVLNLLKKSNLTVKSGKLNDYGAPWDSLRYVIGNIACDTQKIEAYIEFRDKKEENSSFKIIWFNATPTNDDKIYYRLVRNYVSCFESLLKKQKIIK